MNKTYVITKTMFVRYWVDKHKKPYQEIQIQDMSDADLELWQRVEALNNVKLGVRFKGAVERNIVH